MILAASAVMAACFGTPEPEPADSATAGPAGVTAGASSSERPVTEAELGGVAVYPGGALLQPQSSRLLAEDGSTVTGTFEVAVAPATVAAFYRDQLGKVAPGAPILETTTPAGQLTLMVDNPTTSKAVQVEISPAGTGSRVKVVAVEFPTG
jgi:hypothetical protein